MYQERIPKVWLTICASTYVVGVVWMVVDAGGDDVGVLLGMAGLFFLVLLAFVSVPVSKYFYNRIALTPEFLRVGRERIPLAELEPASVAAGLADVVPSPVRRVAQTVDGVGMPAVGPRPENRGPRLVGGGWAVPGGMDSVVLHKRDGEALLIATRDRPAFLSALAHATGVRRAR